MSSPTPLEPRDAALSLSAGQYAGTIRSFYPFWDVQYRPMLLKAEAALPVGRFDLKPRPEMFTAHQLVLHVAEAERGWIHSIVEGNAYGRMHRLGFEEWVRPHPDPSQGWVTAYDAPDHESLFSVLEEWHRPTQRWLDRAATELGRVITYRIPDGPERRPTLHWILDHVQEHEIHTRSQLNLYLRLMGLEPPSI